LRIASPILDLKSIGSLSFSVSLSTATDVLDFRNFLFTMNLIVFCANVMNLIVFCANGGGGGEEAGAGDQPLS